jgi:protein arginine N-methyltransferase 1
MSMNIQPGYSMLDEHFGYVTDGVRLRRFGAAIAKAVRPGDVVLDLGCGSGILGLLSFRAGASRVIAIDSTAMIEVAREVFRRSGFANSCELRRGSSFHVQTSELVDVVVCDHVGCFGFDYGILELLRDARERFLKPQGIVLPSRVKLMLGAVQSDVARARIDRWRSEKVPQELDWLATNSVNTKQVVKLTPENILGEPCELETINLTSESREFFSCTAQLTVRRSGILHGLAGWFECELIEGVWMTNSPLSEEAIDRPQAFLPIGEPTSVQSGERIEVTVMARPADNVIAWIVDFPLSGKQFRHSTWAGTVLSQDDMLRFSPHRKPHLSRIGRARGIVLSYCDGRRSAAEIEELVLQEHRDLLPSQLEISRFVGEVLTQDTDQ